MRNDSESEIKEPRRLEHTKNVTTRREIYIVETAGVTIFEIPCNSNSLRAGMSVMCELILDSINSIALIEYQFRARWAVHMEFRSPHTAIEWRRSYRPCQVSITPKITFGRIKWSRATTCCWSRCEAVFMASLSPLWMRAIIIRDATVIA